MARDRRQRAAPRRRPRNGPDSGPFPRRRLATQSLKRGAGSIETDYLNGEIVLLGRLHGVPTPLNAALCALSQVLIDSGAGPGSLTPADLKRRLGLA
jgi:2-dehydropantoate 2-reductase